MLNFDIGGGTTDISVIEYMDENETASSAQNMLVTRLLFKDGQALAGDDLHLSIARSNADVQDVGTYADVLVATYDNPNYDLTIAPGTFTSTSLSSMLMRSS